MQCPQCGYDKNPADALSCSLCGKVFRKEGRKEEDVNETHTQLMSKKEKFFATLKEGKQWEKDTLLPFGKSIDIIKKSKGKERVKYILLTCCFMIGWISEEILERKYPGLKEALDVPGTSSDFRILLGIIIGGFIFIVIWTIYKRLYNMFDNKRRK